MEQKKKASSKRPIETYEHKGKERLNNPLVGLVTPETDPDAGQKKQTYAYDPHIDPQLQWAGKAEHTSFDVPTVSLHVHERIDPRCIIEAVRKRNGSSPQPGLFDTERAEPLRQAIEFYKHAHGWSNRLVAGDSLLVMNSLLEKEGLAGKVQMIYIDPPYGIRYGSNFQPFVNKRYVKDGNDEDLTAEPEQIRAFRDTWELGIHSYLTYLRDRLLLARALLTESGSIFVQISDENVHHVRELMEEVYGKQNFIVTVLLKKKGGQKGQLVDPVNDYLIWFAKDVEQCRKRYHQLYERVELDHELTSTFRNVELPDGEELTLKQLFDRSPSQTDYTQRPDLIAQDFPGARIFTSENATAGGHSRTQSVKFEYKGQLFDPGIARGNCWKHSAVTDDETPSGMQRMALANRLFVGAGQVRFKRYFDDFGYKALSNWWDHLGGASDPVYVVQTNPEIIQRCILMTTDPGDLVFDPTCGSGTTAYVAEQWGRRWITCDTSRVAITLARQRLMTAVFDYYELAHPAEGVGSGFRYRTVPHVTLKSIANNPDIKEGMTREQIDAAIARHAPQETLYDQPFVDKKRARVSGPFTVEAVPAPAVKSVEDLLPSPAGRGVRGEGGEGKKALDPEFLGFVRQLRREQTDAEHLLWPLLRDRRFLDLKFRRQHPIEPYVLDFYCHEARLAIELDGGQHNEADVREREVRQARELIDDDRLIRFLRAAGSPPDSQRDIVAVRLINRHLDSGQTLDGIFYTGKDYGFNLSVEARGGASFRISFGCLAGPLAGDGAEWDVEFDESGQVRSLTRGTMWIS